EPEPRGQALREAGLVDSRRVAFHGERVLPAELGRRIANEREQHAWIPGPVSESETCPVRDEDVKKLYRINTQLTDEDKALLAGPLPSLDQLPTPRDFIAYFDQFKSVAEKIPEQMKEYWEPSSVSVVALERLKHHLADAVASVERESPRFMACVQAGASDQADSCRELIELIKAALTPNAKRERLIVRLGAASQSSLTRPYQIP